MRSQRMTATFTTSATGNLSVVAAVTGKRIRVYAFMLTIGGTASIATANFADGSGGTSLSGSMTTGAAATASNVYCMPEISSGYFVTTAATGLFLTVAGGTTRTVDGFVVYELED